MSTDFAAPTYEGTEQQAATEHSVDQPVSIDINDPQLTSETLDYDPEKDAYAAPPPLPDGKWRVKVKALDSKGTDGQPTKFKTGLDKKTGKPYLYAAHEAAVIDLSGKFDGLRLQDYFVSTMPRRDGSVPIATILHKAEVKHQARTHRELMETYLKWVASEPELGVETQWEWQCQKCQEEAKAKGERGPRSVYGMRKFPVDAKGQHQPELKCEANPAHGYSVARPRISAYLGLGELPKQ